MAVMALVYSFFWQCSHANSNENEKEDVNQGNVTVSSLGVSLDFVCNKFINGQEIPWKPQKIQKIRHWGETQSVRGVKSNFRWDFRRLGLDQAFLFGDFMEAN